LTVLLNEWSAGNKTVESQLIENLYPFLHDIAHKQLIRHKSQSFQTTEVVNEAFIKLQKQNIIKWKNRSQFFAICAQIIKRLLIDNYRLRQSQKRGGGQSNLTLDRVATFIEGESDVDFNMLEFDGLLNKLKDFDELAYKVVELRFFAGLTVEEIADVCVISIASVTKSWQFSRSWLLSQLSH